MLLSIPSFSQKRGGELILIDKGKVSRVTGASLEDEKIPNPNRTDERWNLGGTDLGIIWQISKGRYGLAFGDSYGDDFRPCGGGPGAAQKDWRSNVVAFTEDTDLSDGLEFSDMMHDAERPDRASAAIVRELYREFTYIPTSVICLDGVQYMHYMYWEVFYRDRLDEFYSSFAKSEDGGNTWVNCNDIVRFSKDSPFGIVAMATKKGDKYCYMLGAQAGEGYRRTPGRLARFRYEDVLDRNKYEYWNGSEWIKGDENAAAVVIEGTVGEASLMYLEKYRRWIFLYKDNEHHGISYRTAENITGPWSECHVLTKGHRSGYGSFIHPMCASKKFEEDAIYYTMSQWGPYNVFLMKASVKIQ